MYEWSKVQCLGIGTGQIIGICTGLRLRSDFKTYFKDAEPGLGKLGIFLVKAQLELLNNICDVIPSKQA